MKRYALLFCLVMVPAFFVRAVVVSSTSIADAFIATGSAGNPAGTNLTANNYGGAGAVAIAGSSAPGGEFQSLLKFDAASALSGFNSTYGAGNWTINSITLKLTGNFSVQGSQPNNNIFNAINAGTFHIDWMSNDSWSEGTGNPSAPTTDGITFSSLSTYTSASDETLGTYNFVPPGNNVSLTWNLGLTPGFLADAASGGLLSFRIYAGDLDVSYLFNARSFGTVANRPLLSISAIPEPSSWTLLILGLSFTFLSIYLRRRTE